MSSPLIVLVPFCSKAFSWISSAHNPHSPFPPTPRKSFVIHKGTQNCSSRVLKACSVSAWIVEGFHERIEYRQWVKHKASLTLLTFKKIISKHFFTYSYIRIQLGKEYEGKNDSVESKCVYFTVKHVSCTQRRKICMKRRSTLSKESKVQRVVI